MSYRLVTAIVRNMSIEDGLTNALEKLQTDVDAYIALNYIPTGTHNVQIIQTNLLFTIIVSQAVIKLLN